MSLDPNTWYTLSAIESNFSRSVQWCTQQIVCYSDTNITGINAHWQVSWLDEVNKTSLTLRNRGKGPDSNLAVFLNGNETQPGFAPFKHQDPTQQWNAMNASVGNGVVWSFGNVANGTGFRLAERGGASMFMAAAAGVTPEGTRASQQWIASKVADVNDSAMFASACSPFPLMMLPPLPLPRGVQSMSRN